jgi:hypothetical protein
MRNRFVLAGILIVVALGAWGLIAMTGGEASTPVYDREATRACPVSYTQLTLPTK